MFIKSARVMLNALRVVKIALIGPVATHATERIIIQKLKR